MIAPHTLQQSQVQVVCILGHTDRHIGHRHTWNNKEDSENAQERDCQGRENQTRIF